MGRNRGELTGGRDGFQSYAVRKIIRNPTFWNSPKPSISGVDSTSYKAAQGRHPQHRPLPQLPSPPNRRHPHALPPNLLPRNFNRSNHTPHLPLLNPKPPDCRISPIPPPPPLPLPQPNPPPQIRRSTPLRTRLLPHPPHRSRLPHIPLHAPIRITNPRRRQRRLGMGAAESWTRDCESGGLFELADEQAFEKLSASGERVAGTGDGGAV